MLDAGWTDAHGQSEPWAQYLGSGMWAEPRTFGGIRGWRLHCRRCDCDLDYGLSVQSLLLIAQRHGRLPDHNVATRWYLIPYWADADDVRRWVWGPDWWEVSKRQYDRAMAWDEWHMARLIHREPALIGDDTEGIA